MDDEGSAGGSNSVCGMSIIAWLRQRKDNSYPPFYITFRLTTNLVQHEALELMTMGYINE